MKQYKFKSIATLAIAAFGLLVSTTACTSEDDLVTTGKNDMSISFRLRTNNMTRAGLEDEHADFSVWAYKNSAAVENNIMPNYKVEYASGAWGYANVDGQSLKYFDPASTKTLFYACTPYNADHNTLNVSVTDPVLTMAEWTMAKNEDGKAAAPLYATTDVASTNYGDEVALSFKRAHAKVGISFVESVSGYKVKIITLGTNSTTNEEYNEGVYAQPVLETVESNAYVTTGAAYTYKGTPVVTYGATPSLDYTYGAGTTSSALLTFAAPTDEVNGTGSPVLSNDVYYMVPSNSSAANCALYFHISFQLINDENVNDVLTFRNVKVLVPADNTVWEANKSYTYNFEITAGFNGGTTEPDPNDPTIDPDVDTLQPIKFAGLTIADLDSTVTDDITVN